MKTKGMKHQIEALRRMNGRNYFGLFCEQGTGKTWIFLADLERLYSAGKIDAALIIAPKGVHVNWVKREIPAHLKAPVVARAWKSGAGKREMAFLEDVMKPRQDGEQPPLRILAMNIDALNQRAGLDYARRFIMSHRAAIIVDESSRIKSEKAGRTIALMSLRPHVEYARIGTGTPVTNAPTDVFSQMEFLESGLLGTTSFRAFNAEYSELMDVNHPMMKQLIQKNPRMAWAQIVATDEVTGAKKYRNLDKLQKLLLPHTFRVLKKDCLDLPEKIYKDRFFDLAPRQLAAYKLMEKKFRILLEDGSLEMVSKLNSITKLQQITSGFVIQKDGLPLYVSEDNPRLAALEEYLEDHAGKKVIIWAHFREELKAIAALVKKMGRYGVEFHGGIKGGDKEGQRDWAVDEFQDGKADTFIGQQGAGGIGITLTAGENVIYYSNSYNLEHRLQSEDRAHRKGTKNNVVYTDLVADGTIDEEIAQALQRKENLAALILGDR